MLPRTTNNQKRKVLHSADLRPSHTADLHSLFVNDARRNTQRLEQPPLTHPLPTSPPPLEDFDNMLQDLQRIFTAWSSNNRLTLQATRDEIVNDQNRLQEERIKLYREIEDLKQQENKRLRDARLRAEQEMAAMAKQVATERDLARHKIQQERNKLEQDKQSLKHSLKVEQDRLRRELEALDTERRKVVDANIATQTMIEVNVGGVVFETARQVLVQQKESYLAALFSGRHQVERDRNGRIFIDRDSQLFSRILNFLRDPEQPINVVEESVSDALCREANFFGISFYQYPQVLTVGGHDGVDYLRQCELYDLSNQCWMHCASMETPRAYFASSAILNRVYAAGGQNLEYKALCDVECYDVLRDVWSSAPALITPRKSTGGAVSNGKFYVVGGFDGSNILSSVECLDPRMRKWMDIAPLNTPRSSAMVVAHEHQLIVLGGSSGERLRSAEVLDLRMEKWTSLPNDMLEIRSGGCAATIFDSLLVFGGIDAGQRVHDSVEMIDLRDAVTTCSQPSWTYRKPMPEPSVDAASCHVGSNILLAGGQAYGEVHRNVNFYRPDLDEWQAASELLIPRFGHGVVACNI